MAVDLGTLQAHIKLDGVDETQKQLSKLGDSLSDVGSRFGVKLPSSLQDSLNEMGGSITNIYQSIKEKLPEGFQKGLEGLDSAAQAAASKLGITLPEGMGAMMSVAATATTAVVVLGKAL